MSRHALGYLQDMRSHRLARATFAALAVIAVPFAGACADEDGDGATTDEEIQDVRDETKDAEKELEEEVDGQNEGSNENDGG